MTAFNSLKNRIYLTNGMAYFLIGISLPLITLFFFQLENLFWSIPAAILPIILGGHYLYYLEINSEKLIVKNLIFFCFHKEYKKQQITDISLYINRGVSDSGNDIITKGILIKTGGKSKKYPLDYNDKYYIDLFYKLKKFKYKNSIFRDATLTRKIIKKPDEKVHITFEKLKSKDYTIADNIKLVQNITTYKLWYKIFLGIGSFFLMFMLTIGLLNGKSIQELYRISLIINLIFIIPMLIGLYYIFIYLIGGEKEIVFNRKENTITFPTSNFNKKTNTISFNNFKFHKLLENNNGSSYSIITREENKEGIVTGVFRLYSGRYSNDFYSYIVWYMYSRRPLPPSEVFDLYRKIDYKQREDKNFLKPLYSKNFKTPEATRKEQNKREQINNW